MKFSRHVDSAILWCAYFTTLKFRNFQNFCTLDHFNFAIFSMKLNNYLFYLILEEKRTTSFTMTLNFITRDAATGLHENSNNKVLTIFSRILLDHDLHSGLYKFCLRHPLQAAHLLSSRQIVHLLALGSAFPLVPWTSKWLLHCSWMLPFLLSLLLVSPSLLVYVVTVESVLLFQWRRHQRLLKTGILKSSVVISHDSRAFKKKIRDS